MDKMKIAVWGITDAIFKDMANHLDWRKIEISFFIDNDPWICGKVYEGIRIYHFDQVSLEELEKVDYILIAAYSGYQSICRQINDRKIEQNKVQLYISTGLKKYNFDMITHIDKQLIMEIYYEPYRMLEIADKYNRDVKILEKLPPIAEKKDKWYKRYSIIAHACGGWVDGKKMVYTNAREALRCSLKSGAKVVECDISRVGQNEVLVCNEHTKCKESVDLNYTMQSLEDVFSELITYKDVHLLIDVKWNDIEEYGWCLSQIMQNIGEFDEVLQKQLKEQIIMEVYGERSIQQAKEEGFDVFFTQYRNPDYSDFQETLKLCLKYDIGVVGFDFNKIDNILLSTFKQKNISVFAFSCDSIDQYSEMRQKGLDGIFSNFILENNF